MDTNASDAGTATLKGVRRAAIWTIIVSLVIAAGIGIATIVSGEFGEIQGKVLLPPSRSQRSPFLRCATSPSLLVMFASSVGLESGQACSHSRLPQP